MPHPWIDFVKQWAQTHNMKYGAAMGDPQMREAYHSRNEAKPATPLVNKPHPWIDFVKQWALTHNVKYGAAMADPKMRNAYHSRNEAKSKP